MNLTRLIVCALAVISFFGCVSPIPLDPLPTAQGWRELMARDYTRFNPKITDDYKMYISELPNRESIQITDSSIRYFGNTNGQHAVSFETGRPVLFGEVIWAHVLIYDESNKRIKVVNFKSARSLKI